MTSLEDTIKRYDMMSQRIDRQFEPLKWLYENSALASVRREQAAITAALGTSLITRDYKTAYDLSRIPALEESRALSRRIQSITQSVNSEALSLAMQYKSASSSALSLYNSIGVNLEFLKSTVMPSSWLTQQVTDLAAQVQNVCLRMEPTESCPPLRVEREVSLDDETADLVAEVISSTDASGHTKSEVLPIIKQKMSPCQLIAFIIALVTFVFNVLEIPDKISTAQWQNRIEQENQANYKSDAEYHKKMLALTQKLVDKAEILASRVPNQNQYASANDAQATVNSARELMHRESKNSQRNSVQDKTNLKPSD